MTSKVYFSKITDSDPRSISQKAKDIFSKMVDDENISLSKNLPIKIHPGAIGNTAYLRPELYSDIILYLKSHSIKPYFIETCMSSQRSEGKEREFTEHSFTQIPFVIADGATGDQHEEIPISNGKHFKTCFIAEKLAKSDQVLVINHFKGHGMAGFGGAIKMLGIGFASGWGKTVVHSRKSTIHPGDSIDWEKTLNSSKTDEYGIHDWNPEIVFTSELFRQRVAEYATAAAKGKNHVYMTFAMNFSADCDCSSKEMAPLYPNLGILASKDPVAIDKAVIDLLSKRENKIPFTGSDIFPYAESLGLGTTNYEVIEI